MKRGALIALEGLDGCGKTTQLPALAEALRAQGREVVTTREPTDGAWGRRIRAMARSGERIEPEEELHWFMQDRREHVDAVIAPALAGGSIVLTDRYFLSTVAYQGARGLDWRAILARSEAEFPLPERALVFEVAPAVGLARVRARAGTAEPAFEQPDFLARVASIFAELDRPYLVRIDGDRPPEAVRDEVLTALEGIRFE